MADAIYRKQVELVDYTPGSNVSAGDLIWNSDDTLRGIASDDITASVEGTLVRGGVFDIAKKTTVDTFAVDQDVYWDTTNGWATPSRTTKWLGKAFEAAAATDTTVKVSVPVGPKKAAFEFIEEEVTLADFTDNTDATGYADLSTDIPAGCEACGWEIVVATGFTGDTTAVCIIGVDGDTDRFSAVTTVSVLAAGTVGCSAKGDANQYCATATTPRVTVTGGADFGSISAGSMTVRVYYQSKRGLV